MKFSPSCQPKMIKSCRNASLLPFARRKHQVEVVSHILIEVCYKVVVVPKVKINLVIIVIVGIDIVINIDYKGYHSGNKTHVAESI